MTAEWIIAPGHLLTLVYLYLSRVASLLRQIISLKQTFILWEFSTLRRLSLKNYVNRFYQIRDWGCVCVWNGGGGGVAVVKMTHHSMKMIFGYLCVDCLTQWPYFYPYRLFGLFSLEANEIVKLACTTSHYQQMNIERLKSNILQLLYSCQIHTCITKL